MSIDTDKSYSVKPYIYESYSAIKNDEWMKIPRSLRVVASLQAPAVEGRQNYFEQIEFGWEQHLVLNIDEIVLEKRETYELTELKQQNGEYIVSAEIDANKYVNVVLNNSKNVKTDVRSRYYNNNKLFTFFESANSEVFKLYSNTGATLKNIKVYFISDEEIEMLEGEFVKPTNLDVDLNDSYEFDLDMKKGGLVATTIPFDKGYEIYIDGKKTDTILIDGSFIGANISSGNHRAKIIYKSPWKNWGLIVTLLSTIIFILYAKKDAILNKINRQV